LIAQLQVEKEKAAFQRHVQVEQMTTVSIAVPRDAILSRGNQS
jgi:hypothetical protein